MPNRKIDIRHPTLLIALTLLGLSALSFRNFIVSGKIVLGSDLVIDVYPRLHFMAQMLKSGQWPLWNPYAGSGYPLEPVQTPTFYPFSLLALVLPVPLALGYGYLLAIALSGLFTYLLGRQLGLSVFASFLSALAFMFNGHFYNHIYAGHFPVLHAMIWLPLLFCLLERALRWESSLQAIPAGIALGCQITASMIHYTLYILYPLSLYFAYRFLLILWERGRTAATTTPSLLGINRDLALRLLSIYLLVICLGFALGAVSLFPLAQAAGYSLRSGGLGYETATTLSFPIPGLLTLLIPGFFGNEVDQNGWLGEIQHEIVAYVGVLPLILAVVAVFRLGKRTAPAGAVGASAFFSRRKYPVFFGGLALLSLVLAMGRYTPLYKLAYYLLPGFKMLRAPSRFLFIYIFAASILAGYGADYLLREETVARLGRMAGNLLFTALMVAFGVGLFYLGFQSLPLPPEKSHLYSGILVTILDSSLLCIALLLVIALVFLLRSRRFIGRALFQGLLLLVVLGDLWLYDDKFITLGEPQTYYAPSPAQQFVKKGQGYYRFLALDDAIPLNVGMFDGALFDIQAEAPLTLQRYWEFINQTLDLSGIDRTNERAFVRQYDPLVARMLNVRYVLTTRPLQHPTLRLVETVKSQSWMFYYFKTEILDQEVNVYLNEDHLPRAFVVHQVEVLEDGQEVFEEVRGQDFDPRRYALLEKSQQPAFQLPDSPPLTSARPRIVDYQPHRIVLEVEMPADGLLVLSEVYYPGWQAAVDGRRSKVYQTDYILRSVFVPGGKHRVEFTYDPLPFKLGLVVSALAALGALAGMVLAVRREAL